MLLLKVVSDEQVAWIESLQLIGEVRNRYAIIWNSAKLFIMTKVLTISAIMHLE